MQIAKCLMTLALAFGAGPSFAATITAAQWIALVKSTKPGGVIDLGDNDVEFQRTPLTNVTIKGGRFRDITIDAWRNVTFDGSHFELKSSKGEYRILALAYEPDGLTFRECTFRGAEYEGVLQVVSMSIRGGRNVTVERSRFDHIGNFIAFHRTEGVKFIDNDLSDIREGVQIIGGSRAVISGNRIGPFRPSGADHSDGVQLHTAGLTQAAQDVLIENNLIISSAQGRAQCIFMRDEGNTHAAGKGYARITVRGNRCVGTGWHGITAVDPIEDLVVDGNVLLQIDGPDAVKNNWIMVGNGRVTNNRASLLQLGQNVQKSGNITTGKARQREANALIAEWLASNRGKARPVAPR